MMHVAAEQAAYTLNQLHRFVAVARHENFSFVKRRFDVEMSIVLQKANYRAFARRNQGGGSSGGLPAAAAAAAQAALILEAP